MKDEQIKKLFDQCTVEMPGSKNIRALNFDLFQTLVAQIYNNGYADGHADGVNYMGNVMDLSLKSIKV